MKPLVLVLATLLTASVALSQRGSTGNSGGSHSGGGHSGVGHTGGGFSGGFAGGGHTGGGTGFRSGGGGNTGSVGRGGPVTGGYPGGHGGSGGGRGGSVGGHGGYSGGRPYGRTIVVPYAVPVYGYGYAGNPGYGYAPGYGGSAYAAPADADTGYGYAAAEQPPAPAPEQPTDFGPNGGQPLPPPDDNSLQIYQAPAPSPQETAMSEGRYYLIAYKDHSVYTALAFWMENGALHYVTPQNAHNQVSLDLLDMDLTRQLNARRGLAFNIVNQ